MDINKDNVEPIELEDEQVEAHGLEGEDTEDAGPGCATFCGYCV